MPSPATEQMLATLRRVTRAIDLHSRHLAQTHGLTGSQALALKHLAARPLSPGELALAMSLSQATVTDLLNRLEQRGLVARERDAEDGRRVRVHIREQGQALLGGAPPLLQERFVRRFEALQDWEQTLLLSSMQRIASMMDAPDLDPGGQK